MHGMNRTPIPWPRILAEAVVIAASILLALAADAWWDGQQATQLEADVLSALADEVAANQAVLREDRATIQADQVLLDRFLRSDPEILAAIAPDSVVVWARALSLPKTYDPRSGAASLLSQMAALSSEGIEVRALLSEWLTRVADAGEEKEGVRLTTRAVHIRLAPYAARARRGRADMTSLIAALGPAVLAELRADSDLVYAVVRKATIQEIYLRGLETLGGVLDSLAAVLEVE